MNIAKEDHHMLRKLLLGFSAAATLGVAAIASTPVAAQPFGDG